MVPKQYARSFDLLLPWLLCTLQDDEDNQGGAAPAIDMDGQHRTVRQEPPPFKVLDYVVRIEWQKRGYPHAHILLWADVPDVTSKHRPEDAPDDIDWSDEEQREAAVPTCAEDLSDKYICTKSAHRWKEDTRVDEGTREVNAKLATMVEHTHGAYCGKYAVGSCRFVSLWLRARPREAHQTSNPAGAIQQQVEEQFGSAEARGRWFDWAIQYEDPSFLESQHGPAGDL